MLRRFRSSESGNVSIIFALALLPLLGAIGLSIDFARLSTYRTQLQTAVDSAALALAYADRSLTDAQLKAEAEKRLNENFITNDEVLSSDLSVERGKDFVSVSGSAEIRTTIMNLFGYRSTSIGALGKAVWGSTKVEVVLVLDNTGSMNQKNKLTELKKAAKELIDILEEAAGGEADLVKIGIVPFATSVRVDPDTYRSAPWLRWDASEKWEWVSTGRNSGYYEKTTKTAKKSKWLGCIIDRNKNYDISDESYTVKATAKFPAVESCPGSEGNLAFIQPLTNQFSTLRTHVQGMEGGGNTNFTIGMAWAQTMLSPSEPFTQGANVETTGNENIQKYIIALTDGENTESRFEAPNSNEAGIDARTRLACNNAKALKNTTVFTIRLIDGDVNLIRDCASDTLKYFDVKDAGQLSPIFRSIAQEISKLRLAV